MPNVAGATPEKLAEALLEYVRAIDTAAATIDLVDDTYFDVGSLKLPDITTASGPLDERSRLNLLKQLGVVAGVQGTSRVWLVSTRHQTTPTIVAGTKDLLAALQEAGGELAKDQIEKIGGAHSDAVVAVLKVLELIAGMKGRAGGVRLAARVADDLQAAEKSFADSAKSAKPAPAEEAREHEAVYYPLAADALQIEGFQPTITGVRQRARGEWSTPDVVGYYVRVSKALAVPIVRIGTVEVKHRLSRSGIAEAVAHRRFAHYSYIAVPEPLMDVAPELREECIRSGIGLMCFKQRNSASFQLFIDPAPNRPDEELVDELLSSLSDDDDTILADRVGELVRIALGQALFGSQT